MAATGTATATEARRSTRARPAPPLGGAGRAASGQPTPLLARPTCMRTLGALVVIVLLAGCTSGGAAPSAITTTPTTTPTSTPSATSTTSHRAPPAEPATEPPGRAWGTDLTLSGPPRIPWVDGRDLRFPDGRTVALPRRWTVTSIARHGDGYLVTDDRALEGVLGMHSLGADGSVLASWTSTGPARPSRDGRVAWVSLVAPESERTGPTLLHADSADGGAEVTQRLDRSRLPIVQGWFRGRLVYRTWGDAASYLTDLAHRPRPVPRAEDLGVLRPDGAYRARITAEGLEILHHDGALSRVVRIRGLGRTMWADLAWEDDRHVLTTITRNGRQAVARIGVGGRVSLATGWREAGWTGFAFLPPVRDTVGGSR